MSPQLNLLCKRLITVTALVLLRWLRLLLLMPFQMTIQIVLTLESIRFSSQNEYFFVHPSTIHTKGYSSLCELRCRTMWSLRLNAFSQPGKGHGNGFYIQIIQLHLLPLYGYEDVGCTLHAF